MGHLPFVDRDRSRFGADIETDTAGGTSFRNGLGVLITHLIDVRTDGKAVVGTGVDTNPATLALIRFNDGLVHSRPPKRSSVP